MKTPSPVGPASGVLVEFVDPAGHTLGQALFPGWLGKPLPDVGDVLACDSQGSDGWVGRPLRGKVVSRHFDLQRAGDETVVWVRLRVLAVPQAKTSAPRRRPACRFSSN